MKRGSVGIKKSQESESLGQMSQEEEITVTPTSQHFGCVLFLQIGIL